MKSLLSIVAFALLAACNKPEKPSAPNGATQSLETAAADFKARVAALQTAKIENVVFADVRHDVVRTNSITSPLKAEVTAKKIVRKSADDFTTYDVKIFAQYRDGEWHYERCSGKMIAAGSETEIEEDTFNIQSAFDFVKTLRLKHDDIHLEQFK